MRIHFEKKILSALFFTVITTALVAQDGVVLYEKAHFKGLSETLYASDPDLGDNPIGHDSLRSVHVPDGCVITLYEDRGYRGREIVLDRSHFNLRVMDFARKASSVRVEWQPGYGPVKNEVQLFAETNFRGLCEAIHRDDPNLSDNEIGIGPIRSLRLPAGWSVTLFSRPNYRGQSVTLTAKDRHLNRDPTGLPRVASLRIAKPQLRPRARTRTVSRKPSYSERRQPVVLYRDSRFDGRWEELFEDDPDLSDNPTGNDNLSSIEIPSGVTVVLYEDVNFRGDSIVVRGSVARLGETRIGNDRVSSIRIEYPLEKAGVTLHQHNRYKGRSQTFDSDVPDLAGTHIGNDTLSSIEIPPGYQVVLYAKSRFRGRSEILRTSDPDLGNNRIGNDTVSSIRIERVRVRRR